MKLFEAKKIAVAALLMLSVPASLLAQEDKKEKKEDVEQIIITRKGAADGKTVIEIDGEKITVNGKAVDKNGDEEVRVMRHKLRDLQALTRARVMAPGFDFEFDNDHLSLFTEDSNRAMMGVTTKNTEDDKAKGAQIVTVSKGSAADRHGLQAGDIITKIGDKTIEKAEDVTKAVREHKPGERVDVMLIRKGKEQKHTVELDKWKGVNVTAMSIPRVMGPEMWAPATPGAPFSGNVYYGGQPRLGLSIQDTEDGKGVKVLSVTDDSNAEKAGLEEDDIITHVDNKAVNSADEVSRAVKEAKDKTSFTVKVLRDGKSRTMEVRTPRRLKTTTL
ncbi:MAG: PDZ domain-containing protein [Chitinophagaceae bacterium]